MGGSKGGRHSKNKGKSKSKRSDESNKKPESSLNYELDSAANSNDSNRPKHLKDKNPQPSVDMPTTRADFTEKEMEELLYIKVYDIYENAKKWLLSYGYSETDVERAILKNGHIGGPNNLLDNILINSIAVLENKFEPQREAFECMSDLCDAMLETMVEYALRTLPNIQRSDAVWHLLRRNWGMVPSISMASHHQPGDQSADGIVVPEFPSRDQPKDDDSLTEPHIGSPVRKVGIFKRLNLTPELAFCLKRRVPILAAAIRQEIGAPDINQLAISGPSGVLTESSDVVETENFTSTTSCSDEECDEGWLESNATDSEDPKVTLIVDLLKSIRDLEAEVQGTQKWAQQKVVEAARRLSRDLVELKMLRAEKLDKRQRLYEKDAAEKACILKLLEKEQTLRKTKLQANATNEAVRKLEAENAQIRAESEAFKLNASESDRDLKDAVKKEKKWSRKLTDLGKQNSHLQVQIDELKERVLLLKQQLLLTEKEAEEAEMKWRQEIQEKTQMSARLAEEIRIQEAQKASSRAKLSKLREKLELDSRLARDECCRLEDELSRLCILDVLPDDDNAFYNSPLAISFTSNALSESSQENFSHRSCMICSQNEVSVVFLPCTHQVVCLPCYESNWVIVGGQCPCCQAEIEQSIKVFGPSS